MDAEELYRRIETKEDWEMFIIDTVRKAEMDPWDIDIIVLAEKFLVRIRELQVMDYRIPAKVVLSSAILLRMKSDTLVIKDSRELLQEYAELYYEHKPETTGAPPGDFPLLEPALIRTPQRKVTLIDLLSALRTVLKDEQVKTERRVQRENLHITLTLPEFNITDAIKNLYERIKTLISGKRFLTFFGIIPDKNRLEIARAFLPMLYLANDGKIRLEQESLNEEIKIYLAG